MSDKIQAYTDLVDRVAAVESKVYEMLDEVDSIITDMHAEDFPRTDTDIMKDAQMKLTDIRTVIDLWLKVDAGSSLELLERRWGLNEGDLDY